MDRPLKGARSECWRRASETISEITRPNSDTWIERGAHRISARAYLGVGPPLVLMHGFSDSCTSTTGCWRACARPGRSSLRLPRLGCIGQAGRLPYTATNQARDLAARRGADRGAVLEDLRLV